MTSLAKYISTALFLAGIEAICTYLTIISEKLPSLVNLTSKESRSLSRIENKSRTFIFKVFEIDEKF